MTTKRRKSNKTKKKKKTYFKKYDLYSDANPKDTVRIRYKTKEDVRDTISKLNKLYKRNKITHARNVQIANVMTQRLRVIKQKNSKLDNGRYEISKRYFEKLKKRTKDDKTRKKKKKSYKMNIYNKKLKPCGNKSMGEGSWDRNYKCSEKGGGVHQICIKKIGKNTKKFSKTTGQDDWSTERGDNNHCVCLGAWSLYNAKNKGINKKNLKCDSIPKYALSKRYISKFGEGWNKWNGLELDNQIVDGVESMVKQCSKTNIKNKNNLMKNYCDFAKNNYNLHTKFYKNNCL